MPRARDPQPGTAARSNRRRTGPRIPLTEVEALDPETIDYRRLPHCTLGGPWHKATREWWRALQALPDVAGWHESDLLDFEGTALVLRERLARINARGDSETTREAVIVSTELRMHLARFGLGPAERARQRITIVSADEAEARAKTRRKPKAVADVSISGDTPADAMSGAEALAALKGGKAATA